MCTPRWVFPPFLACFARCRPSWGLRAATSQRPRAALAERPQRRRGAVADAGAASAHADGCPSGCPAGQVPFWGHRRPRRRAPAQSSTVRGIFRSPFGVSFGQSAVFWVKQSFPHAGPVPAAPGLVQVTENQGLMGEAGGRIETACDCEASGEADARAADMRYVEQLRDIRLSLAGDGCLGEETAERRKCRQSPSSNSTISALLSREECPKAMRPRPRRGISSFFRANSSSPWKVT